MKEFLCSLSFQVYLEVDSETASAKQGYLLYYVDYCTESSYLTLRNHFVRPNIQY